MAKGGTSLNPGADPTLVQAAFHAAMANVPVDYSKAFTAMAEGYGKYAEGMSKAFTPMAIYAGLSSQKLVKQIKKDFGDFLKKGLQYLKTGEYDLGAVEAKFSEEQQTLYNSELADFLVSKESGDFKNFDSSDESSVKELQRKLQEVYGPNIIDFMKDSVLQTGDDAIDGKFGSATQKALQNFQSQYSELQKTEAYAASESEKLTGYLGEHVEGDEDSGYSSSWWQRHVADMKKWETTNYKLGGETYDLTDPKQYKTVLEIAKKFDAENVVKTTNRINTLQTQMGDAIRPSASKVDFTYNNENNQPINVNFLQKDDMIRDIRRRRNEASKITDPKKKAEKLAELDKIFNNMKNSQWAFAEIMAKHANVINDDNFNAMASGGQALDFLRAAAERGRRLEDGSRIMRGYTDDGKEVMLWVDKFNKPIIDKFGKPFAATAEDMDGYLIKSDAATEVAINDRTQTQEVANGKVKGAAFNETGYVNDLTKLIKNEEQFVDAIHTTYLDNESTFAEAVWGVKRGPNGEWVLNPNIMNAEMYKELTLLGDRFDFHDDDVIDRRDFVTEENKAALANYLTSYNSASIKAFANFMKPAAKRYFDVGAATTDETPPLGPTGWVNLPTTGKSTKSQVVAGGSWIDNATLNKIALGIEGHKNISGPAIEGYGSIYKWDASKGKGGAYVTPDGRVLENKATLYGTLFGGNLSTNFLNNDNFTQITDWAVAGAGGGDDALNISADEFVDLRTRMSAAGPGLKKIGEGYNADENGKAVYDWLKEKGIVDWFEAQGGQIKYDSDNKEWIWVKAKGDDSWSKWGGDSWTGPWADAKDLRQILKKMGFVKGATKQEWKIPTADVG